MTAATFARQFLPPRSLFDDAPAIDAAWSAASRAITHAERVPTLENNIAAARALVHLADTARDVRPGFADDGAGKWLTDIDALAAWLEVQESRGVLA
ncbi:hypothetical protein [Demequina sp.]|uniref:hypothetical protein n=1 Tax=Demequina sp. TaxID=2050685 RepID=UPI003D10DD69